jgi:2-polyprenyl-3-methyl-5-hydroxy-6-metoxy-1,4-benzoquinol methylase
MPSDSFSHLYGADYFLRYLPNAEDHRKRRVMYRQEYSRIRQFVRSGTVLDVGCGVGDFLECFEPENWIRYGIDISTYALERASGKDIVTALPASPESFFDLVVFRGTIQHLDEPVSTIRRATQWLKPGGYMVFLATPNIGGICYRLFQDLPALDPTRNFMLVSDRILSQLLRNLGMDVVAFEFPYRGTPYGKPIRDSLSFALRCLGVRRKFAFWGNMMECYARKPEANRELISTA